MVGPGRVQGQASSFLLLFLAIIGYHDTERVALVITRIEHRPKFYAQQANQCHADSTNGGHVKIYVDLCVSVVLPISVMSQRSFRVHGGYRKTLPS